jgi:hypothetical protein
MDRSSPLPLEADNISRLKSCGILLLYAVFHARDTISFVLDSKPFVMRKVL